jgi:hypothetical protein
VRRIAESTSWASYFVHFQRFALYPRVNQGTARNITDELLALTHRYITFDLWVTTTGIEIAPHPTEEE